MFDFLFKCLSSLASFAFPVFASYKALQQDDITLIKPWLMYWVVIAIQLTAESYLGIFLLAIPFYQLFRFGFMLWLVLPQTQGASQLYVAHVRPFLTRHENEIDRFIAQSHANAKAMGVEYLSRATHFIKEHIYCLLFGTEYRAYVSNKLHSDSDLETATDKQPGNDLAAAGTGGTGTSTGVSSYTDMLFSRFRYPPTSSTFGPSSSSAEGYSSLLAPLGGILSSLQSTAFSLPSGLKSKSEITDLRAKLMSAVSTLDERLKKMEDEPQTQQLSSDDKSLSAQPSAVSLKSATSESDFDMVKAEELENIPDKTNAKHGSHQVDASAADTKTKSGWFW